MFPPRPRGCSHRSICPPHRSCRSEARGCEETRLHRETSLYPPPPPPPFTFLPSLTPSSSSSSTPPPPSSLSSGVPFHSGGPLTPALSCRAAARPGLVFSFVLLRLRLWRPGGGVHTRSHVSSFLMVGVPAAQATVLNVASGCEWMEAQHRAATPHHHLHRYFHQHHRRGDRKPLALIRLAPSTTRTLLRT